MEEVNPLSSSTERIVILEGGHFDKKELPDIGVIFNKENSIVYIGSIKDSRRDGYGVQFEGNQDNPICRYEGEWKEGKKVPGGIEYSGSPLTSSTENSSQEIISIYNLFTHLTLNNFTSLKSVLVNCIQDLIIANGCYYEDTIAFHEMKNLTSLLVGDGCCINVQRVLFNNSRLTRIEIGNHSFSGLATKENHFTIGACPLLTTIRIGIGSFHHFSIFSIMCNYINFIFYIDAPQLTELIIGDKKLKEQSTNFQQVQVVNLESTIIICKMGHRTGMS